MRGSSAACTVVDCPRLRFRFGDFFVRMCLAKAFFRLTRPDAVSENRFLAPLFDFILGIVAYLIDLTTPFCGGTIFSEPRKIDQPGPAIKYSLGTIP